MENRDRKPTAELLRDFAIFFAVIFFTCLVGIIELLPEFDRIRGIWGFTAISSIYFGLLAGVIFSIYVCFWLYEQNRALAGKFGFRFFLIEPFYQRGKILEKLLIAAILVIFTLLYLVKIGILQ